MRGDIYIAAHLRRCLRHSVFGHVLQYTPSTSVLDALHLHHAIKSPPLRYLSPLHIALIEVKNELVKMKDVFPMKVITHTIMHQENLAGRYSHSIMYPVNFAGGRSRLDLLLPSFLPSREEKKKQERRKQSIDSGAEWHNPHTDRVRTETKMQERRKQSIDSGAEWHTPFMRQGKRDAVWRDTFLEQRAHVAIWRDRRLEERSSHVRLQLRTSGENSKPYKSSLVALSEQLRDIFAD